MPRFSKGGDDDLRISDLKGVRVTRSKHHNVALSTYQEHSISYRFELCYFAFAKKNGSFKENMFKR